MDWRRILSGQKRDGWSHLLRGLLTPISWVYSIVVRIRNARYTSGSNEVHAVNVPVIAIGNITAGGTGKTPFVVLICQWLQASGLQVAIVSRGYGKEAGQTNDEAKELLQRLPTVPHIQNRDRVAASLECIKQYGSECIVLDDAFQHRRIHRDLNLVTIDATCPWGYDRLLPRGLLREPVSELRRADACILTRADQVSDGERLQIRDRVAQLAPQAVWAETCHRPTELVNGQSESQSLCLLRKKRVLAFCAIGNSDPFYQALKRLECEIVCQRTFPDHHRYTHRDLEELTQLCDQHRADLAVCTCKDLVKLSVVKLSQTPLWALKIDMSFSKGAEAIRALVISRVRDFPRMLGNTSPKR